MADRTTEAAVKALVDVESGKDLTPFITVANELVTECCVGGDHSDTRLELIERWLAAHFYAVYDSQAQSEQAGAVRVAFEGRADMFLERTKYGQQALILDTEGSLAALNSRVKKGKVKSVGVTWLGTEEVTADD